VRGETLPSRYNLPMSYSIREVSAMLGIPAARIRDFAEQGFLEPERGPRGQLRFGFQDLIVLRTAGELAAAKIPQRKVRRVLRQLREQLPPDRSLTGLRISADGERVVVRDGASVWNPENGQSLFDFSVSELVDAAAPVSLHVAAGAREKSDGRSAAEWYELGCELEGSSPAEAKEAYQRALAAEPQFTDAHVNLGRLFHEEGSTENAERHYRAALTIDPHHDVALFNLGVALEDAGRIDEAIRVYRGALAEDPENADAHYNLAGLYERKGEKQAAIRHLKAYRRLLA
jgi:tetratricopeptide (TPR) repeat protein